MAKNGERRNGFVARWFKRIWWLRRVVVLGAIAGGIIQAVKRRGGGGAAGFGSGPDGPGRPAPVGAPSAPTRSASVTPEANEDQTVAANSASTGTARTLVAVPPLDDDASVDDDAVDSAPLLSLVSDDAAATAVGADRTWADPLEGGECPPGYPVKANDKSRIYHVPQGRSYQRTVANRCYPSVDAAEADGYRAAKA